jgi:hypothetical protein
MTTRPIFVVGPSRSGTALTRALLNRHPDVSLAGETHYFDDLRVGFQGRERSRLAGDDRRRCEDYFLALSHRPYGHAGAPEAGWMDREELRARAEELGGTPDAYFEAFCHLWAEHEGGTLWGEKTPRHVFRMPEIVERYPDARMLCLVRDPRAVVASYRDWRNQGGFDLEGDPGHALALEEEHERSARSYHPIVISLLWNGQVKAMVDGREHYGDGQVRIQRYEDLAADGEEAVRSICAWLEINYDAAMLDVPMQNSSFSRFAEKAGISADAVDRWRRLDDAELAVVQATCRRHMVTFGYEPIDVAPSAAELVGVWAKLPLAAVRAVQVNRDRAGNLPAYVARRARLIVESFRS